MCACISIATDTNLRTDTASLLRYIAGHLDGVLPN